MNGEPSLHIEAVSPTRYALRSRSGRLILVLEGDDAQDVAETVASLAGPTLGRRAARGGRVTPVVDRLRAAVREAAEATKKARKLLRAAQDGSPRRTALKVGDRSGRQGDGVLEVVAYVRPDGASPWWAVRCRSCGAEDEHRACRLRNCRPSCRSCGKA